MPEGMPTDQPTQTLGYAFRVERWRWPRWLVARMLLGVLLFLSLELLEWIVGIWGQRIDDITGGGAWLSPDNIVYFGSKALGLLACCLALIGLRWSTFAALAATVVGWVCVAIAALWIGWAWYTSLDWSRGLLPSVADWPTMLNVGGYYLPLAAAGLILLRSRRGLRSTVHGVRWIERVAGIAALAIALSAGILAIEDSSIIRHELRTSALLWRSIQIALLLAWALGSYAVIVLMLRGLFSRRAVWTRAARIIAVLAVVTFTLDFGQLLEDTTLNWQTTDPARALLEAIRTGLLPTLTVTSPMLLLSLLLFATGRLNRDASAATDDAPPDYTSPNLSPNQFPVVDPRR